MEENKSLNNKYQKIDIDEAPEEVVEPVKEKPKKEKKVKEPKVKKEKTPKEPKPPKEKNCRSNCILLVVLFYIIFVQLTTIF